MSGAALFLFAEIQGPIFTIELTRHPKKRPNP